MILVIDEQLFARDAAPAVDLVALLRLVARGEHGVRFRATPNPRAPASQPCPVSAWLSTLGPMQGAVKTLKKKVEHLDPQMAFRGTPDVLVSNRWSIGDDRCLLTLDEAIRLLGEPLHVLLENGLNDAAFLRCALPRDWREQIMQWERSGRLRFEHSGGNSEMRRIVESMTSGDHAARTWGLPANAWKVIHFFVFDHDGKTGARPGGDSKKLDVRLRQAGLVERSHMLRRRRQEYYLPRQAMIEIARKELTDATAQRAMCDAIDAFFDSTEPSHRAHGPLPSLSASRKNDFWKNRFWERGSEHWWRDEWFADDGSREELTDLAEAIARAI